MTHVPDPIKCPACHYDLAGLSDSDSCPECGLEGVRQAALDLPRPLSNGRPICIGIVGYVVILALSAQAASFRYFILASLINALSLFVLVCITVFLRNRGFTRTHLLKPRQIGFEVVLDATLGFQIAVLAFMSLRLSESIASTPLIPDHLWVTTVSVVTAMAAAQLVLVWGSTNVFAWLQRRFQNRRKSNERGESS